jgi:putative transposase
MKPVESSARRYRAVRCLISTETRVPGGGGFFTVNLLERRGNRLLTDRIDVFRDAVCRVRRSRPFTIDAFVVLPDHLHAVWTLPPDDDDFSTR